MKLKIADAGRRELPASTVHRILCEEVPMYPMDRIQQKHARQIDLLENLTAVIQDYPNPACIRDETGKFIFCNTLFHESFLTQDQSAEKWLLSQRDFCELISVTEMEAYRNEHTHLNLVEDVFIQNRFWTISVQSFLNGHRNIILFVIKTVIIKKRLSVMISEI